MLICFWYTIEQHMTVNDYLNELPPDQKKLLSSVRKTILSVCPEAEEMISYKMPGYKYLGKPLVYFAAFKNHCSLFGLGGTIQFTTTQPVSSVQLTKLLKARMKENKLR